jgi:hypothetical protein
VVYCAPLRLVFRRVPAAGYSRAHKYRPPVGSWSERTSRHVFVRDGGLLQQRLYLRERFLHYGVEIVRVGW